MPMRTWLPLTSRTVTRTSSPIQMVSLGLRVRISTLLLPVAHTAMELSPLDCLLFGQQARSKDIYRFGITTELEKAPLQTTTHLRSRTLAQLMMESEFIVSVYEGRFLRRSRLINLLGTGIYAHSIARGLPFTTVLGIDVSVPMLTQAMDLRRLEQAAKACR